MSDSAASQDLETARHLLDAIGGVPYNITVMEQARKVLEWVNKCPPEYLPVGIDPCHPDVQECAAGRLAKELDKFPADKLLTLISLDVLPAWFRKVAEKRFAEISGSGISTRRHRTRGRTAGNIRPETGTGNGLSGAKL